MDFLTFLEDNYDRFRVEGFDAKYLPYLKLKEFLDLHYPTKNLIGKSFLGNDIYHLKIGSGKIKILAWSQMHGNESTGTRAMLDVFSFLNSDHKWTKELLSKVTFHFVPMLNPDGSANYQRRNAMGVDLNRDYLKESSPEIKVLKDLVTEHEFDYLFNLHDQRTIFNVGHTKEAATLSFLAPSADWERTVTDLRLKSMSVIHYMYESLKPYLDGNMARFSDEFYLTSTGDNFMRLGIPTILFEAGHFPNDYQRNFVRKCNALAILLALESISIQSQSTLEDYLEIPPNNNKALDVVLRNVRLKSNSTESLIDIGIYFEEKLNHETQEVEFIGKINEIGDLDAYFGYEDLDLKGEIYIGKNSFYPQLGEIAHFSVGILHFENGKFIN